MSADQQVTERAAQRRRILLKLETLWNKWEDVDMRLGLLIESLLYVQPTRLEIERVGKMTDSEIEAKIDTLLKGFGLSASGGWKS